MAAGAPNNRLSRPALFPLPLFSENAAAASFKFSKAPQKPPKTLTGLLQNPARINNFDSTKPDSYPASLFDEVSKCFPEEASITKHADDVCETETSISSSFQSHRDHMSKAQPDAVEIESQTSVPALHKNFAAC